MCRDVFVAIDQGLLIWVTQSRVKHQENCPIGKLNPKTHIQEGKLWDIYIYAFIRRFYPKRLSVHSGYTFFFVSMCVPWE